MQEENDPQHLLNDLESIRQLLREETSDTQTAGSEKIPILLETVASIIPTLKEIIDSPATGGSSFNIATPHPVTDITEAQLMAEGEQLIENLLEEYLVLVESRLREQLRLRLSFIIKEQMRKYR